MNILLWVLQILAALMYGASGYMKIFMFDKISGQVPSFGALPQEAPGQARAQQQGTLRHPCGLSGNA